MSIYYVTKGMKRLFFHLLVSFDFLKSILDDAIEDIKVIFRFGLKHDFRYFLQKVNSLIDLDQQNYFLAVLD